MYMINGININASTGTRCTQFECRVHISPTRAKPGRRISYKRGRSGVDGGRGTRRRDGKGRVATPKYKHIPSTNEGEEAGSSGAHTEPTAQAPGHRTELAGSPAQWDLKAIAAGPCAASTATNA